MVESVDAVLMVPVHAFMVAREFSVSSTGHSPLITPYNPSADPKLAFSAFASRVIDSNPDWFATVSQDGSLERPCFLPELEELQSQLQGLSTEESIMSALRLCRNRSLLRILWQDVNQVATLDEVLMMTSSVADVLIDAAMQSAARLMSKRFGQVRDTAGKPMGLVVIGMGKLGGQELNFSSDIDLIFACRDSGETDGRKVITAEEYFTRQIRFISRWLSQQTRDGFCYRVDLRLRPFGDAGRMVLNFDAMEMYFQREGREWERYAWIKARQVAGPADDGDELMAMLQPFIYRRYLDYSAFESLREMKAMILAESTRRQIKPDLKLGTGGIRDIEFIVQAFQLIRGGQDRGLRGRRLLEMLGQLDDRQLLSKAEVTGLAEAYRFLRLLENRVQQQDDRQLHQLPEEVAQLQRICESTGLDSVNDMLHSLESHRHLVASCFAKVIGDLPQASDDTDSRWQDIWLSETLSTRQLAWLKGQGYSEPEQLAAILTRYRQSHNFRLTGERIRQRLNRLVPMVLRQAANTPFPETTLDNLFVMLHSITNRGPYIALLIERQIVLRRLVDLCSQSLWLTEALAEQPVLLDDLISTQSLVLTDNAAEIQSELQSQLAQAESEEGEQVRLRRAQKKMQLSIGSAYLAHQIDAAEVSRRLSLLADALIGVQLNLAQRDIEQRYDFPRGFLNRLAVIGYGSLGSAELGFASDLDLIFIYDEHSGKEADNHSKGIGIDQAYTRIAQRFLHLLTALMPSGRLYEVDVRLRPNGNSGFLISRLDAYQDYQNRLAWTWELQALTRARFVAGSGDIGAAFEAIRASVIGNDRSDSDLKADIVGMREKMRASLDQSGAGTFDLKQGQGGRVDIEFLLHYLSLSPTTANSFPHSRTRGSCAALEAMQQQDDADLPVNAAQAGQLLQAFNLWLDLGHRQALQNLPPVISLSDTAGGPEAADEVWSIWRWVMLDERH